MTETPSSSDHLRPSETAKAEALTARGSHANGSQRDRELPPLAPGTQGLLYVLVQSVTESHFARNQRSITNPELFEELQARLIARIKGYTQEKRNLETSLNRVSITASRREMQREGLLHKASRAAPYDILQRSNAVRDIERAQRRAESSAKNNETRLPYCLANLAKYESALAVVDYLAKRLPADGA